MYNVPTYTKFGLHRVPRTDHRRKSRTPCSGISEKCILRKYHFEKYLDTEVSLLDNQDCCSNIPALELLRLIVLRHRLATKEQRIQL